MRKIPRIVLAVILFVMTIEGLARVDDFVKYRAPLLETYKSSCLRMNDEDGIRRNIPSARFEKFRNNSAGFRGPEIRAEKPEGITRIACMGASETYGLYENERGEWPAQLGRLLGASGRFEVINTASVGLGLEELGPYFDKYILEFQPDLVILVVSPTAFATTKIRERLNGHESVQRTPSKPRGLRERYAFKSRVLPKARLMLKSFLPERIVRQLQLREARDRVLESERVKLKGAAPIERVPDEILVEYREDLRKLVASLQARDIDVILTSYPFLLDATNAEAHPFIFAAARRFTFYMSFEGLLDVSARAAAATELLADEMGAAFVDLQGRLPKSTRYFVDNVHYTDEGALRVAEILADEIRARYRSSAAAD